jgi:hypothetical protein
VTVIPDDLAELRAKIEAERANTRSKRPCADYDDALTWVLSLLPPPPPKYEVFREGSCGQWWGVRRPKGLITACEFHLAIYPDAEQRAREECARLNGTAE